MTDIEKIIDLLGYRPEKIEEWSYSDLKEQLAYLHFIKRSIN